MSLITGLRARDLALTKVDPSHHRQATHSSEPNVSRLRTPRKRICNLSHPIRAPPDRLSRPDLRYTFSNLASVAIYRLQKSSSAPCAPPSPIESFAFFTEVSFAQLSIDRKAAMSSNHQGILVTASKVHVPFKAELLQAINDPRFQGRAPHLVGILATKKEDARSYAEVSSADVGRQLEP